MSVARRTRPVTRLGSVSYDTYVRLRNAPENRSLSMAYHDGVLEIMSSEFRHDHGFFNLSQSVVAYCRAFGVKCEAAGHTTFRKGLPGELKGKGREADASFYLGDSAALMRNKDRLDLSVDPPPSLWIEVDNWGSSASRLPVYAGLGVAEVWRYRARRKTLWMGRLNDSGDAYDTATVSVALPGLTPFMVLDMLAGKESRDLTEWAAWLDEVWFPTHRRELTEGGAGRGRSDNHNRGSGISFVIRELESNFVDQLPPRNLGLFQFLPSAYNVTQAP